MQKQKKINIGLITGGGDCPGLNHAIKGLVQSLSEKYQVIGFYDSWQGLVDNSNVYLNKEDFLDFNDTGGTLLRSAKSFPLREAGAIEKIQTTAKENNLEALIIIGGDSTLYVASQIQKKINLPILGIPKTIDNDIPHTDYSIGFMTAVQTICDSIEKIKSSAKSHSRAVVVEIMGRHAGTLCAYSSLAAGCDIMLVPEYPVSLKDLKKKIITAHKRTKKYLIIAAAEGAILLDENNQAIELHDEDKTFKGKSEKGKIRYGGIAEYICEWMETFIEWDPRPLVLGHLQRGGTPSAMDRILAYALGHHAGQLIQEKTYNQIITYKNRKIGHKDLDDFFADNKEQQKPLSQEFYKMSSHSFLK